MPLSQREFQALLREDEVDRLLHGIGVDVVALADTADVALLSVFEPFRSRFESGSVDVRSAHHDFLVACELIYGFGARGHLRGLHEVRFEPLGSHAARDSRPL